MRRVGLTFNDKADKKPEKPKDEGAQEKPKTPPSGQQPPAAPGAGK